MTEIGRAGRIADPVHGYVDFTGLERVILNHPVAQRLRYISQNGLAHLVFPEVRTSRMSHSLGAMHLASHFLASSLSNSDTKTRSSVCDGVQAAVSEIAGKIANPGKAASYLSDQPLLSRAHCSENSDSLIIMEQGMRLAALFHDLGHLPFSHDFEGGLEQYWHALASKDTSVLRPLFEQRAGQAKPHEHLGHGLALLIFQELFEGIEGAVSEMARLAFECAYAILESAPSGDATDAVLWWLHTLIDGQLDVDRCDYLL